MHLGHRQSGFPEGRANRAERGATVGSTERKEHGGPEERTDGKCQERLGGKPHRHQQPQHEQCGDRDRASASPASADERTDDDERGGDLGQCDRARRNTLGDPCSVGELIEHRHRRFAVDEPANHLHHDRTRHRSQRDVAEESISLGEQRNEVHEEQHESRHDLDAAVEDTLDRRAQESEERDDVLFDADHGVLEPDRETHHDQRDHRERHQPQHILGRTNVTTRDLLVHPFARAVAPGTRCGVVDVGRDRGPVTGGHACGLLGLGP